MAPAPAALPLSREAGVAAAQLAALAYRRGALRALCCSGMKLRTAALIGMGTLALYRAAQQTGVPRGVQPITRFDLQRYLGRWYEVARIDHGFERGLSNASADYALRPGGRVQVINRGYHPPTGRWREARGVAAPVGDADTAHLKVSFFWPLHSSYIVFGLDEDYQHALVSGPSHDYLWLLSRTPQLRPSARARLLEQARSAGFDTGRLLWVDQRRHLSRFG